MGGTLYVVATPIGNLGDLTRRAEETLRSVARVLAEDTRRTRALLSHLGVAGTPVERLDEHASPAELARALEHVAGGEAVALVTDAGSPGVSDPGAALVALAHERGLRVVPIPGASAVPTAISASGFSGPFTFLGFLPRSGAERDDALAVATKTEHLVVLFESPSRTQATLRELAARAPERRAVVARELTKVHEELARGTLKELAAREEWLGEVTIVLGRGPTQATTVDESALVAAIDEGLAAGLPAKDLSARLAHRFGLARRDVYRRILERR